MLTLKHWSARGRHIISTKLKSMTLILAAALIVFSSVFALNTAPTANAANSLSTGQGLSSGFSGSVSTCAIETVGWVICPVMRTIAKLADYGFSFINENYLKIEYSISNTSSGAYTAWEVMRTIANVVFVLAFLVVIYSQITGRNAGGYNIKRILPRLIIGAILVNISYYICVLAIDVSNIIGGSILDIMKGITERIGTPALSLDNAANGFKDGILTDLTSSILTKSGVVWILLAPVAAVIISIAVVSAAGIVLLIARKVIVAMLLLVSPLLFVTYLLPNIEHYFQQWLRLFIQLLLVFPVVAFLLGTGQIISATIINVGSDGDSNYSVKDDSYQAKSGGSGSATTDLAAAAAAVLPLLGVWFMMKGLSSVMATAGTRIAAGVNRGSKSSRDRAEKLAKLGKPGMSPGGIPNSIYDRKPAFSRLAGRRHKPTPGGGANPLTNDNPASRAPGGASRPPQTLASTVDSLTGGGPQANSVPQAAAEAAQKLNDLNNAQINAEMASAAGMQVAATKEEEKKQGKTAKDIFNGMNRAKPASKDQQRSFGTAGAQPGGGGGGGAQPPANQTASYRAPGMAQSMNAPAPSGGGGGKPTIIVAPVQVDASALLNTKSPQAMASEHTMTQPPISGTQEKAKARAQKYIFDSASDVEAARKSLDLVENKPEEAPHEPTDNKGVQ